MRRLLRFYHFYPRIEGGKLPIPEKNDFRPTPEEFAMRGLEWAASYFPPPTIFLPIGTTFAGNRQSQR
jgi:hypothetical protein